MTASTHQDDRGGLTKFKIVIMLAVLIVGMHQAAAGSKVFASPEYAYASTIDRWGNAVSVASWSRSELYLAGYTAVLGRLTVRGWMHRHFVWDNPTGTGIARFDFGICGEVAVGTAFSNVQVTVTGFLRDVTTTKFPIQTVLYSYSRFSPGYQVFITGGPHDIPIQMVKDHSYTIGYVVDVSAYCYPNSYCPMACANVGEQGCSFWWQATGVYAR